MNTLITPPAPREASIASLTPRERIVLCELTRQVTLDEVATSLWVTRNTVKSQVRSAYRKLGVSNRAEAVAWVEAAGLLHAA